MKQSLGVKDDTEVSAEGWRKLVGEYKAYYKEMGGAGTPPDVRPRQNEQVSDNVTAFRRPQPKSAPFGSGMKVGSNQKPQLPVALIFACLLVVYVGIRYFWR